MRIFARSREFKERRLKRGYSQKSLSEAAGLNDTYLSQIENGRISISPSMAKRLLEKLEAEFDDIFFVSNTNKSQDTANKG